MVNTAATAVANGWAIVVGLVSLPLLLHGLGATQFGTWALLLTFSATNGWFSLLDLGLGTSTTREVAARRATDDTIGLGAAIGSGLLMMGLLALVGGLLVVIVGRPLLPDLFRTPHHLVRPLQIAVVAFACEIVLDLVGGSCEAVLEGLQRVDLSRASDMSRRTLVAVATSIAALVTHRIADVAFAALAGSAVAVVVSAALMLAEARGVRLRVRRSIAGELLHYAWQVAMLRPLGVLQRTMDRFIVGIILGPAAVSLVEIATQVQYGCDAAISASSYAVVPSAAWLQARGDHHKLRELLETGSRYVQLVAYPVAILCAVLARPGIHVWVGPHYHEAAGLVALAVLTSALVAPVQVGSNLLLGVGQAKRILFAAGTAIVVNLVASVVLVHLVGVAGAFEGTLISSFVTLPLLLKASLDAVELPLSHFLRASVVPTLVPAAAAACGAGVALLLPLHDLATLVVGGILGSAAYLAAALRFGFQPGELRGLTDTVRGRR